jgi:DNA-binding transcriptional LysR family regulator
MELRQLRSFVTVADELSFTRAAERLHLTQPALTRQIRNLEDELGVRLLDRTKHKVLLTAEGEMFLVDSRRLVELSLESVKSLRRLIQCECPKLVLGYSFNFNFDFLTSTLMTFYQNCPSVVVNLSDMSPAEQLRALKAREIDLGFVGFRPPADPENLLVLTWECVARHELVVVLPADHPLSKSTAISIGDLKSLLFVAVSERGHPGSRDWLSCICQQLGFIPRVLLDVNLEAGIMNFVAEGLGVALVREQIKHLSHPGVIFRPLATPVKADYWIAWHGENRSKALSKYIEILKREALMAETKRVNCDGCQPCRSRNAGSHLIHA